MKKNIKKALHTIFKIKVQHAINMKTFREERREFYILFGHQIKKKIISLN